MAEALAPVSATGPASAPAIRWWWKAPSPTWTTHPAPDDFVAVDEEPVRLRIDPPVYPDVALPAGVEGTVLVRVLVGKNGKVSRTPSSSTGPRRCTTRPSPAPGPPSSARP